MTKETHITEKYIMNPDGSVKEVITSTQEVEVPTQEEIIAEKEAELLKMYKEIQDLKQK